ncbi:hypothetical protein [Peribacillus alkalitolerans]|uniref:hypothetical protein n=1 Tax=Peribacillus alkalitolerans TaxID=1550385 RepID=UPI0013CFF6B2|nr:hypothetical protein [Peribacillus alkalitolerans]
MGIVFIVLLVVAITLLLLSLFSKDRVSKLEEDLEQLSLTYMQDVYQLKRKMKVLEEELLIQEPSMSVQPVRNQKKGSVNEILKSQVISLYNQGLSLQQIERQSTLSQDEIIEIIEDSRGKGF